MDKNQYQISNKQNSISYYSIILRKNDNTKKELGCIVFLPLIKKNK